MEERITFKSGRYQLEGYWRPGKENKGMVITHPHPLYGGTMHNPVVEAVQNVYAQHGYATLRFNFRGVGDSQGDYDNGVGEQDDVRAAIAYLGQRDVTIVALAGYSFGAWVNTGVAVDEKTTIASMMMVSPPVGLIEFKNVNALSCLDLVITGSRDEIAPVHQIRDILPRWNPNARFDIIDGCDHFYSGHLDNLKSILMSFLKDQQKNSP